jgi:hypothetical protein
MEKKDKKKMILIGLGTVATGVLSFFGWQAWNHSQTVKKQEESEKSSESSKGSQHFYSDNSNSGYKPPRTLPSGGSGGGDDFPLRKGSKGGHVKALQQALIAKYGSSILPKYGADGGFGSETAAGLKTAGLPATIDQTTYNVLVGSGGSGGGFDASKVADALYKAANNQDFSAAIAALKQISNTDQYAAVDTIFKTNYIFGWVHKTIVNAMLDSFTDDNQKQQIRLEFSRMGLKYDGNKWSLSGVDIPKIITTRETEVFEKDGKGMKVKEGTILGFATGIKQGWVYFYPINTHILLRVKNNSIKLYKH